MIRRGRSRFLKIVALVVGTVCLCSLLLSACIGKTFANNTGYGGLALKPLEKRECFSVNFIDVGEGDAVFINFNDGRTMLIDCGEKGTATLNAVRRFLDVYAKDGIDYLILTHPDGDHVGNAADIVKGYPVKKAFLPYLLQPETFETYYAAYSLLEQSAAKGDTEIIYSAAGVTVCGEDYYLVMLSPEAYDNPSGSVYDDVNKSQNPSSDAINNISPIVYMNYKGVRFVFTGDAEFKAERIVLDAANLQVINGILTRKNKDAVNLNGIDFLKIAHHGANDASGEEFLDVLKPKNAVISLGGDNYYGHPSTETLARIYAANPACKILRTDLEGNVSVFVGEDGAVETVTDRIQNAAA